MSRRVRRSLAPIISLSTVAAVLVSAIAFTGAVILAKVASHKDRTSALSVQKESLIVRGVRRSYDVAAPTGPVPSPPGFPLVLVFHGTSGSADQVLAVKRIGASPLSHWRTIGQRERLVIVAPDGLKGPDGNQAWDDCRGDSTTQPTSDDVAFTVALIGDLVRTQHVDPHRIFAVGMSSGGHFVYRLALEAGRYFAGFGPISAALPARSSCTDRGNPRPMVVIHGRADPLIPFDGGLLREGRGSVLSHTETVSRLARRSEAIRQQDSFAYPDLDSSDGGTASLRTYSSPRSPIYDITIGGGGHAEPSIERRYSGLYERVIGHQNHDLEAAEEQWCLLTRGRPCDAT
jgi:polyhydroxybutyrate depolymerase